MSTRRLPPRRSRMTPTTPRSRVGRVLAHLSSRTLFSSIALLMAAGFFAPLEAQFGNGYDFRREIDVVDAQVIGGAHANFPILVADSLDDLRTTANGGKVENANGYDIIFTSDLAGTTELAHEIEAYNPATGDFTIWVRVESLVATTKIYMFYGNSSIGTFQGNVTSNGVTGVWDNDFLTVLHLHDDFLDATSNGNDVTNSGSTDIAGKIGDGQDFDGVNDRLADEDAELFINGLTAVTVELWIKSDVTGTDRGFMETEEPDNTDDILALRYDVAGSDAGGANVIKAAFDVGSGENDLESSINVQTTNWQHVVYSWSSGNAPSLYLDGGVDTPTSAPAAQSGAITGATKLIIGEGPKDNGGSSGWDGKIDEVRISGVARAAQWIQTEYNNQNSPGSFLTVGSEQDGTGPDGTAPADVTALATGTVTTSSVALSWTAPGDDSATGTATTYDVRYSTSTITAGNWASATQATGEPAPSVAGSAESFTVTGLSEGTTYYFAIKTSDEVPNESPLSNVPSATPDGTAPADVTDLATGTVTTSSVALSWTAPGDDGATGTATTYDVRHSTSTITAGNWASATQATGEPSPSVAGSAETFTVTGLSESTTHYFAIKTSDEGPNESALSNVPSAATATTAPATVTALATGTVTASSVALSWTAPGDDGATGTATTYDVRYSTSTITAGNWASATQATGEPAPSVAGSAETFTVTGLSDENTTYYFAIKTSDEVPNESALSNVPSTATANTAPDAVTDLTGTVTASSVALSWTAPGDDGATGTATTYDVRYSTSTITAGNWASATQATGEPAPSVAASAESFTVTGLSVATTYYFAIKTSDEVPNESALSNVLSAATARTLTLPLYLEGDAVTTASLTATAPSQSSLPNYDPGRNSDAGLLLTKSSLGLVSEADAIKYQIWVDAAGPVEINGPVVLGFWSAVKDFPTDKRGIVDAGLFECDTDGTNCSVIVQGSLDQTPWSSSGTWASSNIDFGTVSHTVQAGKALAVKVTIGNAADDNMWLAYWTTAYPAQLGTSALDGTAPDAVTDLATGTVTTSSVALSWTAPGDDGATGTATTYDVRYSTSTITAGNWASATQATGEPAPSVAGSAETFTVTGLSESTTYYFAIKTSDEVPNESGLSNVPSSATATTAPADVTGLATGTVTTSSVALSWTASGDDGATGTATTYDVRYSTSTITAGNWASATQATGEPAPSVAGSAETFTVTGLSESTTYYFAIKTSDEVPNESGLSNVPSTATADGTAPADVTDLATGTVTTSSVALSWTAPGDDGATGTATTYDVRYSTSTITAGNWASATQATGEPAPSVAGSAETFTVTGLSESTTYYFAIKTSDEVPNESGLSNVPSSATATTAPADVTGLATGTVTTSSVALSWTASGDDGATGTATTYDVRYSTSTITAGNWASATQATGEPAPSVAGSAETFTVTGLSESTTYYFAIKTSDEVPNESGLSNVPSTATADGTAPADVTDLATGTVTTSSVALSWTAPGDDGATGTATTYDVRYSTSTITAGNWASATQATGEPAPSVAGSAETFTVTGLSESTTYYFAIKTSDEEPNESGLSNVPSAMTADGTAPDAVSDLATGTVTTSSVALSWTAPGDDGATGTATTYDIRYSTSTITAGNWASATQATGEPAPSVAGSAETFTVTGLSESTTYFFAIKTSDEEPNESALSNVPSAATATTAPDAVTDLATGTVTATSVALSWTAPGDDGATGTATTYDVRYSTSTITAGNWASATPASGEPAPSVAGSAETFTVTGLSESTTYYFAIKTSDEVPNESTLSNVPSAATASTAPDAVTDLATGTVTTSSVALSWTAPGDDGATGTATTYDVRYSTSTITAGNWASATQASGEPAPSVAGSAETFTVTGLSNENTTYYFAIKTSDEVPNESGLSNVPSAATATTAPDAVTDLATGTVTETSVALSWTAPGDDGATGTATTYDIRYSTSTITAGNWASATQATGEPAPSVAGSSESFTVTGLSESITYYFAIKTSDEVPNESALSNVPSGTTSDDVTAPDAVTDLATGTVTTSSVALSWTAPGDDGATGTATTYDVRYSTSTINAGNWASATQATGESAPQVAGSAETFTVTGLSESTTYYFAIKTSDEVPNESALSNVPSAATATTAPADVTDLATGAVTATSVALSWTAPGDDGATGTATTYDVRYSTSTITAGNWASATQATGEPAPSVAGSAETFTVTGLSNESTTYYFAIKTSDAVPNESGLSNVPSAVTGTFGLAVTPNTTTASRLPSNGTNYTVDFTVVNGGSGTDDFDLLTTRSPGTAITVVSITGTGVTQDADPDSARVSGLAAAGSAIVTVTYSVGDVAAGTADTLFLSARSVGDPATTDDGRLELTVVRPNLTTVKAVTPNGTQLPGTELTYTVTITNDGSDDAVDVVITNSLAVELDFKVGSVVNNLPSGVSATVEYSNDAGSTWTYLPVSAACSAPATFDSCVTHIRWTLQNDLGYVGPDNTGNVQYVTRIQ